VRIDKFARKAAPEDRGGIPHIGGGAICHQPGRYNLFLLINAGRHGHAWRMDHVDDMDADAGPVMGRCGGDVSADVAGHDDGDDAAFNGADA
jgi:hypothetical protein